MNAYTASLMPSPNFESVVDFLVELLGEGFYPGPEASHRRATLPHSDTSNGVHCCGTGVSGLGGRMALRELSHAAC